MSLYKVPILFIVFKKTLTTFRVFERIKEIKPERLFVVSDGPRNSEEKIKVERIRSYIDNNIDWDCVYKKKFRDKNLGVGFGVNDAID